METVPSKVQKILNAYDIDAVNGFLRSTEPLKQIPFDQYPKYKIWEDIFSDLPQLIIAQSFSKKIDECMPIISNISDLLTSQLPIKRRALKILSFFAAAFINEHKIVDYPKNVTKPKQKTYLPENISIPLYKLCQNMKCPPSIRHDQLVCNNWRLLISPKKKDFTKRHTLDNIALNNLFLGGIDENWFFLIAFGIESHFGTVLYSILSIQEITQLIKLKTNIDRKQVIKSIKQHLSNISKGIEEMRKLLLRYYEKLDGHIFYRRVRIFLTGCESCNEFPYGVELRGVSKSSDVLIGCLKINNNKRKYLCLRYNGGSAAQSAVFPVIDSFLNIDNSMDHFLKLMNDYIPWEHRQFIGLMKNKRLNLVQCLDILRGECYDDMKEMDQIYNECIQTLRTFRTTHMKIAHDFIVKPAGKLKQKTKGTGGTKFISYLKSVRDRTGEHNNKSINNNTYIIKDRIYRNNIKDEKMIRMQSLLTVGGICVVGAILWYRNYIKQF